jgi:hypothetical protein
LLVVRLACGEEQLRERISSEERRPRLKTTDSGKAQDLASLAPFPINHDWILDLDTSSLSAAETAERVERELLSRLNS